MCKSTCKTTLENIALQEENERLRAALGKIHEEAEDYFTYPNAPLHLHELITDIYNLSKYESTERIQA